MVGLVSTGPCFEATTTFMPIFTKLVAHLEAQVAVVTGNKELREALHEVDINSPCVVTNIISILSVYLLLPVIKS